MNADLDLLLLRAAIGFILLDGGENIGQLCTEEDGHDGRGRFIPAEAVIVPGRSHAQAQHILIIIHCLDHRAQKQQELRVLRRGVTGFKQVHTGIRGDRPVVVLAAAVDPGKRLFMQQANHVVLAGDLLHQLHGELVVVGGDVRGRENRRKLMLTGGSLVMLGLSHDAELPQLLVQFLHKRGHTRLDRAEIVVIQLLTLGRLGP